MSNINHSDSDNIIGNIKVPNFAAWLKAQSECLDSIDVAIAQWKREMLVHAATWFGKTTIYKRIIKSSKWPCWINLPSRDWKELISIDLDVQLPKHIIDINSWNEDFLNNVINILNPNSVIICTYSLLNQIHKNAPQLFDKLMTKLWSFEYPAQIHSDEAHRWIWPQTILALKSMTKWHDDLNQSEEIDNAKTAEDLEIYDDEEKQYDDTITDIISKNSNIYNICRTATPTYSHKSVKNHFSTIYSFTKQQALEIWVSVPIKSIPIWEWIQYISKENYTEMDLINGYDKYYVSRKTIYDNGTEIDEIVRADQIIVENVVKLHKENPVKWIWIWANIDHLYELEKSYQSSWIKTYIVHSGNKKHKASWSLQKAKDLMESGQIDMILVCNTWIELLDIPILNLWVIHYSLHSPVKLNQFIGRICRAHESKPFAKLICPPTKIIYEPKEKLEISEDPKSITTHVSDTVWKLRREDAYYTLGDFSIEYLVANWLTYLQVYKDYIESQKSKRELIEASKPMIRKIFQSKILIKTLKTTKNIYETFNLWNPYDIDDRLEDCKDIIAMSKVRMYQRTSGVRLWWKEIYIRKSEKINDSDIVEELSKKTKWNKLLNWYNWNNLTKSSMSDYLTNIEELRKEYEIQNDIIWERPAHWADMWMWITNRNISHSDIYKSFVDNSEAKSYSDKLLKIALPYMVYIVDAFQKNVLDNMSESSIQSFDYLSKCIEYFIQNIPLYQNSQWTNFIHWINSVTIDILLNSLIEYSKYGIKNEDFIKDINYISSKEELFDEELWDYLQIYKSKKQQSEQYILWNIELEEDENLFWFWFLYTDDLQIEINRAMNILTDMERNVIEIYFWLNWYREKTPWIYVLYAKMIDESINKNWEISTSKLSSSIMEYIWEKYNFTNQRVYQIKEKALVKLRKKSKLIWEYVWWINEDKYILPYHVPHKLDAENQEIIPYVLGRSIFDEDYITQIPKDESDLWPSDEKIISINNWSSARVDLMNFIAKSPLFAQFSKWQFYTFYDYLIWYTKSIDCINYRWDDDLPNYSFIKILIDWFDKDKNIINMIKLSNVIRRSKWLPDFDIYNVFQNMNYEQILKCQKFIELTAEEIDTLIKYISCEKYPQNENLSDKLKVKLDKLMNINIIWSILKQYKKTNLRYAK